jgi:hypothetical protein
MLGLLEWNDSLFELVNGSNRSSKSRLSRRFISAHAGGDLFDFISGERWIASFIVRDKQRGLDLFGSHPAPAHRSGQARQCVIAIALRDCGAYCRAPVRA